MTNEEQQTPPQPGSKYSINALQNEIIRLRTENGQLRDNMIYMTALYSESQDMVGSLLKQLSRDAAAPEDATAEDKTES